MDVIITFDIEQLQAAGVSDEMLAEHARSLGLPIINEPMLRKFKVLISNIDTTMLTRLKKEPTILDISTNVKRSAI